MTSATPPRRFVRVEHIMGTAVGIHVVARTDIEELADAAARRCFDDLHDIDRVFSPYRPESDVSRLRRGEAALADIDPRIAQVAADCDEWERVTAGRFSASWRGGFDPTGFVKGWSVENAARAHLAPLLALPGAIAVGINAGGDLQLFTAPGEDWTWQVGIADPARPGGLAATIEVVNGAVATSGTAERGAHIIDPRTGEPARDAAGATVVADGLAMADVWATAAVVAGFDDLGWISGAGTRTGIVFGSHGGVRRWLGATEIAVGAASADALAGLVP